MKKVLVVLLVLCLLGGCAAAGYWWYRHTHVFIDDAVYAADAETLDLRDQEITPAYFEQLRQQLPPSVTPFFRQSTVFSSMTVPCWQ